MLYISFYSVWFFIYE